MFRNMCLICFLLSSNVYVFSQKASPVSWDFELKQINTSEHELIATASIKKDWVLYSQFTDENGPIPTQFVVNGKPVSFEEKTKALKEFDALFDVEVIKFKEKAVFSLRLHNVKETEINGYVTYMACDGAKCLPPVDVNFSLNIKH